MTPRAAYLAAFGTESAHPYPTVDAFEKRMGYVAPTEDLLAAAQDLACPLKVNPPNWQHGRVLYALLRAYLAQERQHGQVVDIGTAKGYSAVVMAWALRDASRTTLPLFSIDIVDPFERVQRNSIAELDGLKTVPELVAPHLHGAPSPNFRGGGSVAWLKNAVSGQRRIGFAFVDGKHNPQVVHDEIDLIARCQANGDWCVFDDMQIEGLRQQVRRQKHYAIEWLEVLPKRSYALGMRL